MPAAVEGHVHAAATGAFVQCFHDIDLAAVDGGVGPELLGKGQPFGPYLDRNHPHPHGARQQRGAQAHGPLAEYRQGLRAGQFHAPDGSECGAGPASDSRPFGERQWIRQRHQSPGGHLHIGSVGTMTRYAVDDDVLGAKLRPPGSTAGTNAATAVVVAHDPRAQRRLGFGHRGAPGGHHTARLVTRDHRAAVAPEPQGLGAAFLAAGCPVEVQIATAHAGGLDLQHHLVGSRRGIGKIHQRKLAITEKYDALHGQPLLLIEFIVPGASLARSREKSQAAADPWRRRPGPGLVEGYCDTQLDAAGRLLDHLYAAYTLETTMESNP